MDKIKFKDLSGWLKAAIIVSWYNLGYYIFWFLIGFIEGLLGL
jgi:hypothetical protein